MDRKHVFLNPDGTADLGLCLVIECPTRVMYANQCAGYATEERSVEGYLIPLGARDIERRIYDFFRAEFHGHCYEPIRVWTEEAIRGLQAIISEIPDWLTVDHGEDQRGCLALDLERIDECVEAWIPVRSLRGRGILMLRNSD